MHKTATAVQDYFGLSKRRHVLMEKIRSCFGVPARGVVFVLERESYQDYPNPVWRSTAVHLNIEVGGVEERSPEHLLKLMESCQYSHLIWLSRQACEARNILFAWILAHELRHLEQDLYSPTLSKAGHFLVRALGTIEVEEPKIGNSIPTELDANLRAYRLTQRMFGTEVVKAHVQNEFDEENRKTLLGVLERCEHGKRYDVSGCTVALLRKYSSQLKEFQKRPVGQSTAAFDIDKVCSELSVGAHSIDEIDG